MALEKPANKNTGPNGKNSIGQSGANTEKPPLLAWREERNALGEELRQKVQEGQEVNYLPESKERDPDDSINPDNFENIKNELNEIFRREFPQQYQRIYSNRVVQLYKNILLMLPEALTMQAMTENGTERQLRKEFRDIVREFAEAAEDEDMDLDEGLFILKKKEWRKPVKSEHQTSNRFLKNRNIKDTDKLDLSGKLQEIEQAAEAQFREQFEHFFTDDFSKDKLEFVKIHTIPFYREYYLNRAIMKNTNAGNLARDYSQFLDKALRSTLK